MRKWLIMITLFASVAVNATDSLTLPRATDTLTIPRAADTLTIPRAADTLTVQEQPKKKSWLKRTLEGFTYIDTNYVEPQHYNWSIMLQGTYNYDIYRLSSVQETRQSFTFAPDATIKFGPYFGWRWVFFGYTFDLRHMSLESKSLKQEINFSFYSAQIGADFYYRRTGSDYRLRNVRMGDGINAGALEGLAFDGISVGITGFDVYYIFNHKRFSYPAAFNQSTCQKISCGSWMVGFGYMRNSLEFDHERLQQLIDKRLPGQNVKLDSGLMFNSVKYYNTSASVGYAYNWVFARNWLLGASLSLALAYKKTKSETDENVSWKFSNFSFGNFNLDGIGRFGLVYNDTRWYAGASAIVRAYNYHKSQFSANNIFGCLNIYAGYNFGARDKYKKKKKK